MAKVSNFEHQLSNYIHFQIYTQEKRMKPLSPPQGEIVSMLFCDNNDIDYLNQWRLICY